MAYGNDKIKPQIDGDTKLGTWLSWQMCMRLTLTSIGGVRVLLMGKLDLRTTELCSEKESEQEEWKSHDKNNGFSSVQQPMAEKYQQDVFTKKKKSLSNLKQRKSATWWKTTGILWNPFPFSPSQSPSPTRCYQYPGEFQSFMLVQVWSNSIKTSGFTPVCTSYIDMQIQFEGCKEIQDNHLKWFKRVLSENMKNNSMIERMWTL